MSTFGRSPARAHPVADRVLDPQRGEVEALQRAALRRRVDTQRLPRRDPVRPGDALGELVEIVLVAIRAFADLDQHPLRQPALEVEQHHLARVTGQGHAAAHRTHRSLRQQARHLFGQQRLDAGGAGKKQGQRHRQAGERCEGGSAPVNSGDGSDVESGRPRGHGTVTEASLAHPSKKLAVSLVAMIATLALFAAVSAFAHGAPGSDVPIINPAIDQDAYLRVVGDALGHRAERRLSEAEFIRMSREPGRSSSTHAAGQVRRAALRSTSAFPTSRSNRSPGAARQDARILIYCNNNFSGAAGAFPSAASASLNLPTVALYDYGYRSVTKTRPADRRRCRCARLRGDGRAGALSAAAGALHRLAQLRRRDLQRLAVLGDGAPGDLIPCSSSMRTGTEAAWPDPPPRRSADQRPHRGARRGAAGVGAERRAEEILELEGAERRRRILGRGHARDVDSCRPSKSAISRRTSGFIAIAP